MIELILLVFFGIDILTTYIFMCIYRAKYPRDKKWIDFEMNKIAKIFWRKFGLHKGTIYAFFCVLPVMLLLIFIAKLDRFNFGLYCGIYVMVFYAHLLFFEKLIRGL